MEGVIREHLRTAIFSPVPWTRLFAAGGCYPHEENPPPFLPVAVKGALGCKVVLKTPPCYQTEAKQAQSVTGTVPGARAPAAVGAGETGRRNGQEKVGEG